VSIGSGVAKWRPPQSRRRPEIVRAALSTIALYTAIAWCYVAVVAVLRPSFLSESITHWLPVRRDTFGTVGFAVSAVASTALGVLRVRNRKRPHPGDKDVDSLGTWSRVIASLAPTAAIYGLLIWCYIAANSIAHPQTLALPLTHFVTWPAEGDTGSAVFAVSAFAHFLYRAVGSSAQTQPARRTFAATPNPHANRHRAGSEHSSGDRVVTVSETIGATATRSGWPRNALGANGDTSNEFAGWSWDPLGWETADSLGKP
jgi:hypothetical protein